MFKEFYLHYQYLVWLLGITGLILLLEQLRPRVRLDRPFRGFKWDLAYIVWNGHFLGVVLAWVSGLILGGLHQAGLNTEFSWPGAGIVSEWGFFAQLIAFLIVIDFGKWGVHILLHRVPALWQFHKVHHSIEDMRCVGNFRFHWAEVIIYDSLMYLPMKYLGASGEVLFAYAIISTIVGHLAHANIAFNYGPLRYVINTPDMHYWHHVHDDSGPINRNFAITFAVWDWLFKTSHMPDHDPARMGFEGIEAFPKSLPRQLVYPLLGWPRASTPATAARRESAETPP